MTLPSSTARRVFALFLLALVAVAQAATVKFDIPAQPAPAALQLFIKQSGFAVMFSHDELAAIRTNAVVGEFDADAAMTQLLSGTGFSVRRNGGGEFVVGPERQVTASGSIDGIVREEKSGRPVAGATVVVGGTDRTVVTDKRGRFSFPEIQAGDYDLGITAAGMQNTKVTDVTVKAGHRLTLGAISIPVQQEGPLKLDPYVVSAKKNDGIIELDPYAVEGRKEKPFTTANMDIPRTRDDVQPYYIFDSKTIDQSAAINVEDFLKRRLTMNTSALSSSQVNDSTRGNISSFDLRGLGTDKTLILINGRRAPGIKDISSAMQQPDLNGIPLSAIDRIEVIPSSASGIYGGGAVGGVINVVLKNNYSGTELRAGYSNTWDSDTPDKNISAYYGTALEGGKTHLKIGASWSESSLMLLADRKWVFEQNIERMLANNPRALFAATTPFLGALPNIAPTSSTQTALMLKNGAVITSRNTHVQAGTSSTTSAADLYASLLANGGSWNLDLPYSTQSPTGLLLPFGSAPSTKSFQAGLTRQMSPWLELFADFSYGHNRSNSIRNTYATSITVPIAAPTNPFTTAVRVNLPDAAAYPSQVNSISRRFVVGGNLNLPFDWRGVFDYSWSESQFDYFYYNFDTNRRNADVLSGALNPFVDSLAYPLDFSKYLAAPSPFSGKTMLQDLNLRASGPLFTLPWGVPTLSFAIEHRTEHVPQNSQDTRYVNPAENYLLTNYPKDAVTSSGYAELSIPVIKKAWLPAIYSLELQIADRSERYKVDAGTDSMYTFYNLPVPETYYNGLTVNGEPYFSTASYSANNYTFGIKYQPVRDITLRASQATAFLPPTPDQLLKEPFKSEFTTPINDPITHQDGVEVYTIGGGNPALVPQHSKTLNVGLIWEPHWKSLSGLRLNAEYYRIEQFQYIGELTPQQIVTNEAAYPERVTRDATGTITLVDSSLLNLYYRNTEGWDLSAEYTFQTGIGSFNLRGAQSIIKSLENQYSLTLPQFEAAGYSPAEAGVPKRKAYLSVNWDWKRWTAGWSASYISSYKQYGAAGGPRSTQALGGAEDPQYILTQGSDTIASQIYHDLFLGYAFGTGEPKANSKWNTVGTMFLDGLSLQFGMRNAFNTVPPFDAYYRSTYYLSPFGSIQLRSYWLTVKKSF